MVAAVVVGQRQITPDADAMNQFLKTTFDAVVMLTWSDWRTELRSNRYHYATRFARHLPVFFVQPDGNGDSVTFEPVDGTNITLVHVAPDYGPGQAIRLREALLSRNVRKPLLWVYNAFFIHALHRLTPVFAVFHATDDYVTPVDKLPATPSDISSQVRQTSKACDMMVTVSQSLVNSYQKYGEYSGPILLLKNGCDYGFWEKSGAADFTAPGNGAKVAFFQGGINSRLDFHLLGRVVGLLPDWEFWFCGDSQGGGDGWHDLKRAPNVRDFGLLPPEDIAALARQAQVGIIPFKQDALLRRSLPLKAYEYLACGLPVVTVPIDSLSAFPDLFTNAENAVDFAHSIERLAPSRTDPDQLRIRLAAARANSYDLRFEELIAELESQLRRRAHRRPRLNVLMLYDDRSNRVGTVREHLEALQKYSRHNLHFMPATGLLPGLDGSPGHTPDFSVYDALMVHYCVRISIDQHISPAVADGIAAYNGPKLLFIQDEYDTTETARRWMERLGIDAVFTNVPLDKVELVYPKARFPDTDFIPTLTGYVPEDPSLDAFAKPLSERTVLIGYRGRQLPYHYGALGHEKYVIGVEMKRLAAAHGLPVDIEVDDSLRIYGLDWYRFLGSCRATLGTESGSNVFDFDGEIARLAEEHKHLPFSEFSDRFLRPHEGLIRMNQISPKIFESIRLRTALILFEGSYSGVIKADDHYIPLKRDFSNIEDVFRKLNDIDFIRNLTGRAYRDVIEAGRYSYEAFVSGVDEYLDKRALGRRRTRIVSVPLVAAYAAHDAVPLRPRSASHVLLNDTVLVPEATREWLLEEAEGLFSDLVPIQTQVGANTRQPLLRKKNFKPDLNDKICSSSNLEEEEYYEPPFFQRLYLRTRRSFIYAIRSLLKFIWRNSPEFLRKKFLQHVVKILPVWIRERL